MATLLKDRQLTIINFTIVAYFMFLGLAYWYKVTDVWLGVIKEFLTLPFLLAQMIFLFIGMFYILKNKPSLITIISIIALFICASITIGSFFY